MFAEDGDRDEHRIGRLYVRKDAAAGLGDPERVTVTVQGLVKPGGASDE